jgi:hypothetical protein
MTAWHGIVLGAMAFAGTPITGSTADYIGLLGCFPPPDSPLLTAHSRALAARKSKERLPTPPPSVSSSL